MGDGVRWYKMGLVGHSRLDVVLDDNHSMPSERTAACCITQDRLLYAPHAVHDMIRVYIPQPWHIKTQHVFRVKPLMQQLGEPMLATQMSNLYGLSVRAVDFTSH